MVLFNYGDDCHPLVDTNVNGTQLYQLIRIVDNAPKYLYSGTLLIFSRNASVSVVRSDSVILHLLHLCSLENEK